ncbi:MULTISPECIES: hypothetical protein [unclassified Acinetobacter]|uniref:Uncharacterized protein n=1 Tax=Acinetobacter corruptisaponis TaxID=3045147 RepID=A0ABY8S1G1_9GAMM|nr:MULTISPECIES: hypothetical protein [unclassified Acinetobacter]WHP05503.1 hypothetical protein QLH32_16075 [Acinetobacter sp. KCTC 92772]HEO1805939.1 hypothetical protein [Acinetobacter baumannii]
MNQAQFLKRFFEIEAGKKLPHSEETYSDMSFEVTITPYVPEKNYVVVFSGSHPIFPIIIDFPTNEHHLRLGLIDLFLIATDKVRKGKKRINFLKLIDEYVRTNNLIQLD